MNCQEVLSDIQRKLHAPKARYNKFGKYPYRNAEDILDAVKKVLPAGATCILSDEIIQKGERYYVQATATVTAGDASISAYGWAREDESKKGFDASQLTGSTSSYARKYAMNGLFAIDDGVDADTTNVDADTTNVGTPAIGRHTPATTTNSTGAFDVNTPIEFGKFKDRMLNDVPVKELKDYVQWFKRQDKSKSPAMLAFIEAASKRVISGER